MKSSNARKTLLAILADGRFHSGADLARALGVSRTAVWNMMHELKELGLEWNAVSGKGYSLLRPLELLDRQAILKGLSDAAKSSLANLEIHGELDSTNSRLMGLAVNGYAPGGSVCLAEFQTAGRGRIGRGWVSPFGSNICLSLLWWFDDHSSYAGLSLAVGVCIIRALRDAGVEGVGLKWPNDILWQGRKLGGILLEATGEAHGRCAVVIGIGLNLHIPAGTASAIDQPWVDLGQITGGIHLSRNGLIARLLNGLLELVSEYPRQGLQAYIEEWRQWHCMAGRRSVLTIGEKPIHGVVAGVSDEGLLLLECEDGGMRRFASGDLRLRNDDR